MLRSYIFEHSYCSLKNTECPRSLRPNTLYVGRKIIKEYSPRSSYSINVITIKERPIILFIENIECPRSLVKYVIFWPKKNTVQEAVTSLMLLPLKKEHSCCSLKILNVHEVLAQSYIMYGRKIVKKDIHALCIYYFIFITFIQ